MPHLLHVTFHGYKVHSYLMNSFHCGGSTEEPLSFISVGQWLFSTSRGFPSSFLWPFIWLSTSTFKAIGGGWNSFHTLYCFHLHCAFSFISIAWTNSLLSEIHVITLDLRLITFVKSLCYLIPYPQVLVVRV